MKKRSLICLAFALSSSFPALGQQEARLSIDVSDRDQMTVAIQHAFRVRYGVTYPLTYQFDLPPGSAGLNAERRHRSTDPWMPLPVKTADEQFNAIEAVRFDYQGNRAYLSAAFAPGSDSLMIRISGPGGTQLAPQYQGISKYYDGRRAAVTVTGDDCADWTDGWFPAILDEFRSYGLYVTAGVISGAGWCSAPTWADFQHQVDSGFVELASHTRTHPYVPYADPYGEVAGSCDDIVTNVHLPPLFALTTRSYVYTWIAPYGEYDETIDSLLGVRGCLVARLYATGDSTTAAWDARRGHFAPINLTLEIGAPSWGGGCTDTTVLNGTFDNVVAQGGVYHLMWHPQTVYADLGAPYFTGHLAHISRRTDLWYVNLGHLYLYHLLQMENSSGSTGVAASNERPVETRLLQNYPNPFNPTTTINFSLSVRSRVTLKVYDVLGREVATLAEGDKPAGTHNATFDGSRLASGVYFCTLRVEPGQRSSTSDTQREALVRSMRMMLLK